MTHAVLAGTASEPGLDVKNNCAVSVGMHAGE